MVSVEKDEGPTRNKLSEIKHRIRRTEQWKESNRNTEEQIEG